MDKDIYQTLLSTLVAQAEEDIRSDLDYLNFCLKEFPEHTRLLCTRFDSLVSACNVGFECRNLIPKTHQYNPPWTLREAVGFLPMFISHECHDDGSPHMVWAVNPAFPNGRPKLTPENWREVMRLVHDTPPKLVSDPGIHHVIECFLLSNPLEIDGEYVSTPANSLEALTRLLDAQGGISYQPSDIQKALTLLVS
jgi:hypothetical protein